MVINFITAVDIHVVKCTDLRCTVHEEIPCNYHPVHRVPFLVPILRAVLIFVLFVSKTGFFCVDQAGYVLRDLPASASLVLKWIKGLCHHIQTKSYF